MDLISRKQALEEIDKLIPYAINSEYQQGIASGCDLCKIAIEKWVPSFKRWIPCSKQMPKNNGEYLCSVEGDFIALLYYDEGEWFNYDSEVGRLEWGGIDAWMPPPEPYEVKEDE